MCDRADLGGVVDASNLGQTALFVYDRFHGGLGYSRVGFDELERLLAACLDILGSCPCEDGCPACVGLPSVAPGRHEDPDLSPDFAIPGKDAAPGAAGAAACQAVIRPGAMTPGPGSARVVQSVVLVQQNNLARNRALAVPPLHEVDARRRALAAAVAPVPLRP